MLLLTFLVALPLVFRTSNAAGCNDLIIAGNEIYWEGDGFLGTYHHSESIRDVFPLEVRFFLTGPINITSQDSEFIQVEINDYELIFSWKERFYTEFDASTDKTTNKTSTTGLIAEFGCEAGETRLIFQVDVEDTNNNDPTFILSPYRYSLPMPLVTGIDYTIFGVEIIAEDLDFSNEAVTVTIEPQEYFQLKVPIDPKSKQYKVFVEARDFFCFSDNSYNRFTLLVTDTGSPPRCTSTEVTFEALSCKYYTPSSTPTSTWPWYTSTRGTETTATSTPPSSTTPYPRCIPSSLSQVSQSIQMIDSNSRALEPALR